MLSAVIYSRHSYPAFTPGGITGTLAVCPHLGRSFQCSKRLHRIWTKLSHDVLNPAHVPLSMGEQPNPWNVLPLQDATSRHRGAKPPRRCELLGEISLLSLE
ncbi:unnamed protein product [Bathycoccus prasinos]